MKERSSVSAYLTGSGEGVSALYMLTFPNGKRYIGVAVNPRKRFTDHLSFAERGSKFAVHKAIRKFSPDTIQHQVLMVGETAYVLEMEAAAIARFQTRRADKGYNMAQGGKVNPMHIPGVARRVGDKLIGRKAPPAERQNKRASWTPERRAMMSALHKGKIISAEQKAVVSAKLKGRKFTDETREKMRAARLRYMAEHGW